MFNRMKISLAMALSRVFGAPSATLNRMAEFHNHVVDVCRGVKADPPQPRRRRSKSKSTRRRRATTSFKPNGLQECARRARQITLGHLTASNGVRRVAMTSKRTGETYFFAARHGVPILVNSREQFVVGGAP